MLTTSALALFFIIFVLVLAAQGFLLPGIILVGTFILFALWLTGLIETSLQMYGVVANINDNCQIWVYDNRQGGDNLDTMAWIAQSNICTFCSVVPPFPFFLSSSLTTWGVVVSFSIVKLNGLNTDWFR